jgi:4-hydroxy-tetrahydrodipicolinate synthase
MQTTHMSGVHAAILTPRNREGAVDDESLATLVRFLLTKGISSFAVNGATGEFCLTQPKDLAKILSTVRQASHGKAQLLCGVGAPGSAPAIDFVSIAQELGADGLLLPMPYFFTYSQKDLDVFCRTVASSTHLPILLYNLPQFSSGLEKETVHRLISEVPNIIGIKDSSGSLDILRHLTRQGVDASRIVGNDSALAHALSEGVCDGVISGVACALPELVLALYGERNIPGSPLLERSSTLLDEFVEKIDLFPTPWGIKWAVEARDIIPATFSQPITAERVLQSQQMATWLRRWLPRAIPSDTAAVL